jgi:hypothetical protein
LKLKPVALTNEEGSELASTVPAVFLATTVTIKVCPASVEAMS